MARRLDVDALLTGSVTRADGKVRVTVQLVHGATELKGPVAEDDAAVMVETVAENGLVQVMRDLLDRASVPSPDGEEPEVAGWLGTQLEVSRRLRTDPEFAKLWAARADAIASATRDRLARQREMGTLRSDVDLAVLAQFLELAYDGLVLHLAMGRPLADLGRVLDLVETAVRRPNHP